MYIHIYIVVSIIYIHIYAHIDSLGFGVEGLGFRVRVVCMYV